MMVTTTTCPYCQMPALESGFALADGYSRCHLCGWTEMFGPDLDEHDDDSGRGALLVPPDGSDSGGVVLDPADIR